MFLAAVTLLIGAILLIWFWVNVEEGDRYEAPIAHYLAIRCSDVTLLHSSPKMVTTRSQFHSTAHKSETRGAVHVENNIYDDY
jgi:hypothetical protein